MSGSWALRRKSRAKIPHIAIHLATLEYFEGHLDRAIALLHEGPGPARLLCGRYTCRSAIARRQTSFWPGSHRMIRCGEAARLAMEGRHEDAFASLDRRLEDFPITRLLDVPAARMALLAAKPERARKILEDRLPDLVTGIESVNAYNVLPALDLAAAWPHWRGNQMERSSIELQHFSTAPMLPIGPCSSSCARVRTR